MRIKRLAVVNSIIRVRILIMADVAKITSIDDDYRNIHESIITFIRIIGMHRLRNDAMQF